MRGHGDVAALRIARHEELAAVCRAGRIRGGQRAAGGRERIHHVLGLLIAVEIRVIAQRRAVVAHVVRRHHDVAFRREHCGQQQTFAVVRGLQVGDVEGAVRVGAVRIQHDRARALALAGRVVRHHQRRGGGREVSRRIHRLVLHVVDIDPAIRRQQFLRQQLDDLVRGGHGQQLLRRIGGLERGLADHLPPLRRGRCGRRGFLSHVVVIVVAVAGAEQQEHDGQDRISTETLHRMCPRESGVNRRHTLPRNVPHGKSRQPRPMVRYR